MRQRKPLPRSTKPIARRTRVKQKRATPRRSGRVRNEAYLAAVRSLPCYVCNAPAPSDPDHQGEHPMGRKADDDTAVPMCRGCHRKRTDGSIALWGWGWVEWERAGVTFTMREWCDHAIANTRVALGYGKRVGGPGVIDMEGL